MLVALLLLVVDAYILMNTSVPSSKKEEKSPEKWKVYGTTWCGWTTKQLSYLKKKGITHEFVDCEKGKCDGIDAFPVLESPKGERIVGYKEI